MGVIRSYQELLLRLVVNGRMSFIANDLTKGAHA